MGVNENAISRSDVIKFSIATILIIFILLLLGGPANAAVTTYYWEPSTGSIGSSGFTADWGRCGNEPDSYRITTLRTGGFNCNSDRIEPKSNTNILLAIFSSAYTTETHIKGQPGAKFYLRNNGKSSATYFYDVGYAMSGVFTSLGTVSINVPKETERLYTIDFSSIEGNAPAGSYLAIKGSVSPNRDQRVYLGSSRNSGSFAVDEAESAAPDYDVKVILTPSSQSVLPGNQVQYTVMVQNSGTIADSYSLSIDYPDTADFSYSLASTSTGKVDPGDQYVTTMTVFASSVASFGNSHQQSVTAGSSDAANTSNSVTTIISEIIPEGEPSKIIVTVNRYAVWAPYKNDGGTPGSTFTAYALALDSKGGPVSGEDIEFKIYSARGLVSTQQATTQSNGVAWISYDVSNVITDDRDPDSGQWRVDAYPVSDTSIIGSTRARYSADRSCKELCHESDTDNKGDDPKSPYNDFFGRRDTRAEPSHTEGPHKSHRCSECHIGYDGGTRTDKAVGTHSTLTCINCHGNYPSDGIPVMPGCYDCHPNHNAKLLSMNTLGTVRGFSGVSIYSWNFNAPQVAHTSSGSSQNQGIPCVICHGPMHNISKPVLQGTSNTYTEESQCTSCHVEQGKHSFSNPVYCTACHSQDAHAIKVLAADGTYQNRGDGAITTSISDCLDCHNESGASAFLENLAAFDPAAYSTGFNPVTRFNGIHPDQDCTSSCHDITDFHNIGEGGGGPDCLFCHGAAGTGAIHKVDDVAMARGMHADLNAGASSGSGIDPENKKCWGCHQSDGTEPPDNSMGDIFLTPYKCVDCHLGTGSALFYGGLVVDEHYPAGMDITALSGDNLTACITCHNLDEMKVDFTSPDGLFTDFSIVSHYGRMRNDLVPDTDGYCNYCHNNGSTVFPVTGINQNIEAHSMQATIACNNATCHNIGRIHDATLAKPVVQDSLCLECHTDRDRHNGSLNCTSCHYNVEGDIHPIKYLQADNTFAATTDNAVNCVVCHQKTTVDSTITSPRVPPKVLDPMMHSENPFNGTLWEEGRSAPFWMGTMELSKCMYCHGNTTHMSIALGYPESFRGPNMVGGDLSGTWCGSCHYQENGNYNNMLNTLTRVPPEITGNATYGTYPANEAEDGTAYYDHSAISGFTDDDCARCHDLSDVTEISAFMHNVSSGGGGPDCISCHDIDGPVPHIDATNMIQPDNIHAGINSGASSSVNPDNRICWGCHQSDGSEPTGHPDKFTDPYLCYECHDGDAPYANVESAPDVDEHFKFGIDIRAVTYASDANASCVECHNKSVMNRLYTEPDTSFTGFSLASHYGKSPTEVRVGENTNCSYCHQSDSVFNDIFENPANTDITHDLGLPCSECHGPGRIHDETLIGGAGPDCVLCHDIGGPGPNVNVASLKDGVHAGLNADAVNATALTDLVDKACWACHGDGLEPTGHPENYTNPFRCIECHNGTQAGLLGLSRYAAPEVIEHIPEYFEDIQTSASCEACHKNDMGDTTGSEDGRIVMANLSANVSHYAQNDSLMTATINSTNCLYCHNDTENSAMWGDAPLIIAALNPETTHTGRDATSNEDCYDCHGGMPEDLHDPVLTAGTCKGCHFSEAAKDWVSIRNSKIKLHVNESNYLASRHGVNECEDCHIDNKNPGQVGVHGNLSGTLRGTILSQPLPVSGYRYASQNYGLCYSCHIESWIVGAPSGYLQNFYGLYPPMLVDPANVTNFRNELVAGYFNRYPVNIHWDHIGFMSGYSDVNRDGILNSSDSMYSCNTCHEPHGNTSYPAMTKNDLAILYGSNANGDYGQVGSTNFTRPGGDVYCNSAGCHPQVTLANQKYYRSISTG